MLGGMAKVTLHRDEYGNVSITEYDAEPLVTQRSTATQGFTTYMLKDYTEDLAKKNGINAKDSRFSYKYIVDLWNKTMGDEFKFEP